MKIELLSDNNRTFSMAMDVCALAFDFKRQAFTMPLCVGDDWHHKIVCPMKAMPTQLHLQWESASVHFENDEDACVFGAWLEEADARAREGYRTMRG